MGAAPFQTAGSARFWAAVLCNACTRIDCPRMLFRQIAQLGGEVPELGEEIPQIAGEEHQIGEEVAELDESAPGETIGALRLTS
eukprot:1767216-Rhodomonas_salina.1